MGLLEVGRPERHVTTVTLNRPEKRNAINLEMYRGLPPLMAQIGQDRDTRVVIVQGAVASAGADIGVPAPRRMGIELGLLDTGRFVVNFGAARARELLAFGANFKAEVALAKGLITEVAPEGELDDVTMNMAKQLAHNAPLANATWKMNVEMVSTALKLDPRLEQIPWEKSQDAMEAISAFLERREAPAFEGR